MTVLSLLRRGPEFLDEEHRVLRLRQDPSELVRAREFADAAAERFGLSRVDCEDFKLAASEAVANAISHGIPCCDGAIHLWTTEQQDTLTLGVRNGGELRTEDRVSDTMAERGRGLSMIAQLVDAVALSRVDGHVQVELLKERARAIS
jgi:anti-sigma regulatory factor (Ser/Thr protein kinase)